LPFKKTLIVMGSARALEVLFVLALIARFAAPIIDNPMSNLFSDPARHWYNAKHFLSPALVGSIDPKLYQLFLFIVKELTFGSETAIGIICGLMSVLTAYFWYRTCREMYCKKSALLLGFIIAICPSLFFIFEYFMNE